ncbi:MAG: glycoside hydrolase family 3 N-terminal domain-containing protein [Ruminococcus sp.]|nr:glycoside hydrolase family 3 N-terminal domain-containing protein [Ruminococcus sp.]
MKFTKKFIGLLLALLIAAGSIAAAVSVSAADDKISAAIAKMTTEQKITQMLMPAFRYWQEEGGDKLGVEELNAETKAYIEKYGFAGVIMYAQNCKNTEKNTRLIDDMQKANASVEGRPGLLTAVDQEGGVVARLATGTSLGGNMALGAADNLEYTKSAGSIIGSELSSIGFNVDFAPVVDVNNNAKNPVIGIRSFSDDPQTVASHSVSFMEGIHQHNVATSLKHFPGHGNTDTDSHTGLPCVNSTYDELKKCELVPFKSAIDAGTEMIMTAHIEYPNIEKETYVSKQTGKEICLPATLSKTILNDILREDMGYEGIIITDAMNMDAIEKHFDKYDAAKLAINAGVDILLIPTETSDTAQLKETDEYISTLVQMTDNGDIDINKVNKSVERILKLKEKMNLLEGYPETDIETKVKTAKEAVGSVDNHNKEWEIMKKAVTLVKNDNNTLPIKNSKKTVVLAANTDGIMSMNYAVGLLTDANKLDNIAKIEVDTYNKKTSTENAEIIKDADNVVIFTRMFGAEDLDPKTEDGETFKSVDEIINTAHNNGAKVTVVSCHLPYDVARFQNADAIMAAYGSKVMSEDPRTRKDDLKTYGPNMSCALYTAFDRTEKPTAKLPVNIPKLGSDYTFSNELLYKRGFGLTYEEKTPDIKPPVISKNSISLKAGAAYTLKVTNGKVQSWNSSAKKTAVVKNGKVTALKKGKATVIATLTSGAKLTCKVNVTTNPKLSKKKVTVKKGKTVKVKITGKAKSIKNVYKNTKFAKITSKKNAKKLTVKGLKKGSSTLKIKVNGVNLKLKVTVK